jgi:hypothetical protein
VLALRDALNRIIAGREAANARAVVPAVADAGSTRYVLGNELRAVGSQASDDSVDVVDGECDMAMPGVFGERVRVAGRSAEREIRSARAVRGRPGSALSRSPPGRPPARLRGPPNCPRPALVLQLQSEHDEERCRGREVVDHGVAFQAAGTLLRQE